MEVQKVLLKHPMQPVQKDEDGTFRFKENKIVSFLTKNRLNDLADMDFPREDWEQLAQLIGYSLSGFGELNYVSNDTYGTAEIMAESGKSETEARIAYLEDTLTTVRNSLRDLVPSLFKIHADDLEEWL